MRVLLILLAVAALPARAAVTEPAEVAAYVAELARVETAKQPQSLEPLIARADAVQASLMEVSAGPSGEALIETLSEPDFKALQQRLRGLHLQRGMEIFVQPQPEFFAALAARNGRAADRDYFALYREYWGPQLFPIYMEPRARVIGCVKYGDGLISRLYAGWSDYARRHPQDYRTAVQQQLRDFEELVSLGTCACGDRAGVVRELRGFVERFPSNPAGPAAIQRAKELEAHEESLPLGC